MQALRQSIRKLQISCYNDPSISPSLEPFSTRYPWQLYTRWQQLDLMVRLEPTYPADQLRQEFDAVIEKFTPAQQFGWYHRGGWSGVALHAIDGNPLEDRDDFNKVLRKTPALQYAPCMEEIIDSLPCVKRRVRLLRLAPGRKVFWHCDFWHSIDSKLLRLHIPIATHDQVEFQISHQGMRWRPGELWYGDFTFPHRLQNSGETERVHLVIDVEINDAMLKLLPERLHEQRARRMKARVRCQQLMRYWNYAFATESRLVATHGKYADG